MSKICNNFINDSDLNHGKRLVIVVKIIINRDELIAQVQISMGNYTFKYLMISYSF